MENTKINYNKLLLTTENSKLETWDNGDITQLFQKKEVGGAMGLIIDKDYVFVNTPSFIYSLDKKDFNVINKSNKQNAQYHHMNTYNGYIYVSATNLNEIHIYRKNLSFERAIKITPPNPKQNVSYKGNYNHINTIIKRKNRFYVNLNWFNKQYGMSGVAVFDNDWKKIDRFEFGWESHDLQFYDEELITICATSNPDKKINHPKKSGIMINNKLVFEHDPNESFCKALTWDKNYFYLCGGAKAKREDRLYSKGIIYIIDRNSFELVEKINNFGVGNIKGCKIWK